MNYGKLLAAITLTTGLAGQAAAQESFDRSESEFYVGGGYGQYSIKWDNEETDFDEDAEVVKIYGGMKINEYLGAEIGYLNFDEANDFDNNAEIDGFTFAGILSAPLHERVSVYLKGGWFTWEAEVKSDLPVIGRVSEDLDGGDWFYGAGVKVGVMENLDLRLEYERFDLDDDIEPQIDIASASLQFAF
ncbi:porin family protein [Microbulbifer sp. THAF38]|uniref:porin family protein n=1 Tax=Microbulbifer sp. THAF38 TaxID=2587856 RepID=UPI00126787AC|nr:porin family protein [Microbulbifer sp. THAF38]QFT55998.1 outer membrane protein A [Microbulbifer sp. THAF38]